MKRALVLDAPLLFFSVVACQSQSLTPTPHLDSSSIPALTVNDSCSAYTTSTECQSAVGTSTDFDYSYDDVDFVARVWESRSPMGGWRVDQDIDVMRGARLTDGQALHDWFIAYEGRAPWEAQYLSVLVHGHPGWLSRGQVFWLQRPGLAVSVSVDRARWSVLDVTETGWSARPAPS